MILIVDTDFLFAETVARNCRRAVNTPIQIIGDAITATQFLAETGVVPELIFLDVLLVGPDAFTFLNELRSYAETAAVPVVLLHNLGCLKAFSPADLADYGVVAIWHKNQLRPQDVRRVVRKYSADSAVRHAKLTSSPAGQIAPTHHADSATHHADSAAHHANLASHDVGSTEATA